MINYVSNGKVMIIHLTVGLKKNIESNECVKTSQFFLKPYQPFGGDINVKVDLSNYATKTVVKDISRVGTSSFPLKSNLASWKQK